MELLYYFGNLSKQMGDMGNNTNDYDPMSKILNVYQLVDLIQFSLQRRMLPKLKKTY
jgi:hypothetical protein